MSGLCFVADTAKPLDYTIEWELLAPLPHQEGREELKDWEGLCSGCKGNKNLVNKEKEQETINTLNGSPDSAHKRYWESRAC